jgi:predicted DNA-binding protein (UPF0251 family)
VCVCACVKSPELNQLCSVQNYEIDRVLAAIDELGTMSVSKIKGFVDEWKAYESMGFSRSLVRSMITVGRARMVSVLYVSSSADTPCYHPLVALADTP